MYESYADTLESYMIAEESLIAVDQLFNETVSLFEKANLIDKVDIFKSENDTYNTVCVSIKENAVSGAMERRKLNDNIELIMKKICQKNKLVFLNNYRNGKFIYKFGDMNTEHSDCYGCYGIDRNVSFFGKTWNVETEYDRIAPVEGDKIINNFIKKSASISKSIEKEFCDICNKYYDEIGITSNATKYSDIKDLIVVRILVKRKYKSNDVIVKLCGEYDVDCEHGWSLTFINNKWTGWIGQFMDYE